VNNEAVNQIAVLVVGGLLLEAVLALIVNSSIVSLTRRRRRHIAFGERISKTSWTCSENYSREGTVSQSNTTITAVLSQHSLFPMQNRTMVALSSLGEEGTCIGLSLKHYLSMSKFFTENGIIPRIAYPGATTLIFECPVDVADWAEEGAVRILLDI
jgi:hypothetical protein